MYALNRYMHYGFLTTIEHSTGQVYITVNIYINTPMVDMETLLALFRYDKVRRVRIRRPLFNLIQRLCRIFRFNE